MSDEVEDYSITKMDPEVKAKWVKRLRELDGKDMQTHGVLKNEDGKMCCLGVLTEIAVDEGVIVAGIVPLGDSLPDEAKGCVNYKDDGEVLEANPEGEGNWYGITPPTVARWAGLTRQNPYVTNPDTEQHQEDYPYTKVSNLAGLNDSGVSFGNIANYIQADL